MFKCFGWREIHSRDDVFLTLFSFVYFLAGGRLLMSVIEKAELGGASGQQRFPFFLFSLDLEYDSSFTLNGF